MNERIKQLAEQVDKEFNSPYDRHKAIERFAKLIIQEAGEAFWSEACHVSDLAYEEYYRNSKKIKQHFGV